MTRAALSALGVGMAPIRAGYLPLPVMYDPGRYFDEGISADGTVRPSYRGVLDEVGADPAASLARSIEIVRRHEIVFGKGPAKQDFVLDPVPRIVPGGEWDELERGLAQRARALNALIADIYGERRIISEGVIPERVVNGAEYLEPEMQGLVGPKRRDGDRVRSRAGHGRTVPRPRGQHPNPLRHGVCDRRQRP